MNYGPFLSTSVLKTKMKAGTKHGTDTPATKDENVIARKGIVIRLPGKTPASVCFDADTQTLAAGWTGGFLDLRNTMLSRPKGDNNCSVDGTLVFETLGAGWSRPGRFDGLYVNGESVVLSYTVGDVKVLESPEYHDGFFTRALSIEKTSTALTLVICSVPGAKGSISKAEGKLAITLEAGEKATVAALIGRPTGAGLSIVAESIVLDFPPSEVAMNFKVAIWKGEKSGVAEFNKSRSSIPTPVDLKTLCKGGPAQWKPLETSGKVAPDNQAYVVDSLVLPEANPWEAWMRTSGLDFFPDGRAAISTFNGDVWIVSGIDAALEKLTWKRFATGLYEPMGLRVVDGKIYVRGRDQITRLHDLNGDGEADFYENFNNSDPIHHRYHCFAYELLVDSEGNFYYSRGGQSLMSNYATAGTVRKVSKDGRTCETFATGARALNGMGIGPGNMILGADNQGEWIPASKIELVRKGEFLGFTQHHHQATAPTECPQPIVWLPQKADSSCGSQIWAGSKTFGPLQDHFIHTSYGKAALMLLMTEELGGQMQGAVVKLPLTFDTGIMRGAFNPKDRQLYVCGVGGGWQTSGVRSGALNRVRYTGKPAHLPVQFNVKNNGIAITFACDLDKESAADDQNYGIEQWNYKWSAAYGSPEFSVETPQKKGHDTLTVKSAKLTDARTVFLEVPNLKPVMQMQITYKIKAADGTLISQEIYNTINRLP